MQAYYLFTYFDTQRIMHDFDQIIPELNLTSIAEAELRLVDNIAK
jgi:hypothetical protein